MMFSALVAFVFIPESTNEDVDSLKTSVIALFRQLSR